MLRVWLRSQTVRPYKEQRLQLRQSVRAVRVGTVWLSKPRQRPKAPFPSQPSEGMQSISINSRKAGGFLDRDRRLCLLRRPERQVSNGQSFRSFGAETRHNRARPARWGDRFSVWDAATARFIPAMLSIDHKAVEGKTFGSMDIATGEDGSADTLLLPPGEYVASVLQYQCGTKEYWAAVRPQFHLR